MSSSVRQSHAARTASSHPSVRSITIWMSASLSTNFEKNVNEPEEDGQCDGHPHQSFEPGNLVVVLVNPAVDVSEGLGEVAVVLVSGGSHLIRIRKFLNHVMRSGTSIISRVVPQSESINPVAHDIAVSEIPVRSAGYLCKTYSSSAGPRPRTTEK